MSPYDFIVARRSIRRFKQKKISPEILEKFANAGRLAPSGANLQPLEFIVVDDNELLLEIFGCLKWAIYLGEEGTPEENQRPTAYIIILANTEIRKEGYHYDVGLAAGNIMITAQGEGLGSCCLGAIDREKIKSILNIPGSCKVELIIALGYPDESPRVEDMADSIKYWRDEKGVAHVPKRELDHVMHVNGF